ncbi:hypothetical protein SUDANB121_02304 [Nocardiopsis dassonvillei]|uniref:hypothetical protein n=1 Tax=Nocardiopsis dassonvillei TaxID=2014 RepID=UPI003F56D1FA
MKFELLEPADRSGEETATGTGARSPAAPRPPAPARLSQEELLEHMHDRTDSLGTRLTRVIEAVRPSLHRMEAAIARSGYTAVAETGQEAPAPPPEGFRPDRFNARGASR